MSNFFGDFTPTTPTSFKKSIGVGVFEIVDVKASTELTSNGSRTLSFYLKSGEFSIIHNIWIDTKFQVSKSGNFQFINNCGQSTFAADEQSVPSFLYIDGLRKAMVGEVELTNFLRALFLVGATKTETNTYKGNSFSIPADSFKELFKGNVTDFKTALGKNKIGLMVGIRGEYQTVFNVYKKASTKELIESFQKDLDADAKKVSEGKQSSIKEGDIFKAIVLQEYNPNEIATGKEESDETPF